MLEDSKYLLIENAPLVVESYDIVKNSYEIIEFPQEFPTKPQLLAVGEDYAEFHISVKRTGKLFAIVQLAELSNPNARQLKYCLSSTNFLLSTGSCIVIPVTYTDSMPFGYYQEFTIRFTDLFDFTSYKAYFVGENSLPINPDLMDDEDIVEIEFTTQMEIFSVVDWYHVGASSLTIPLFLLALVAALLLI